MVWSSLLDGEVKCAAGLVAVVGRGGEPDYRVQPLEPLGQPYGDLLRIPEGELDVAQVDHGVVAFGVPLEDVDPGAPGVDVLGEESGERARIGVVGEDLARLDVRADEGGMRGGDARDGQRERARQEAGRQGTSVHGRHTDYSFPCQGARTCSDLIKQD